MRDVAFIVLCLIVLIGGFALAQNNELQKPVAMTSSVLFSNTEMLGERPERDLSEIEGERPEMPEEVDFEGSERPDDGGATDFWVIQWDNIGNVFYNLWVMLAATMVVIVIARPIGYLVKRLKYRRRISTLA